MGEENNQNLILGGALYRGAEFVGLLAVLALCLLITFAVVISVRRRAKVSLNTTWLKMTDLNLRHSDPDDLDESGSSIEYLSLPANGSKFYVRHRL